MPKTDPTRTKTLRRKFETDLIKRFKVFEKELEKLVVDQDIFGLEQPIVNEQGYWCLMLMVENQEIKDYVTSIQKRLKKVTELETEPHVTIRYGFTEDVSDRVKGFLGQSIYISSNRLGVFENEGQDVLYLEIESQQLEQLHRDTTFLPQKDQDHPNYSPHITIAYLQPGTGKEVLKGIVPQSISTFETRVVLSSPSREQTIIQNVREWEFSSDPEKLEQFEAWLANQAEFNINPDESTWNQYVQAGYKKGAGRAFTQTNRKSKIMETQIFHQGRQAQFLGAFLGGPETAEKLKLLVSRVFTDIKGVTQVLATQLRKILADGLVEGLNPRAIATRMKESLGTSLKHARRIARTEIIRAHAEGQLDAMEQLGVQEVGVAVEWSTAGDTRVCPLCSSLDNVVLPISKAHNLIPRHPNCRCAFVPANVGEDNSKQKRNRSVKRAIEKSVKLEGGKRKSRWSGKRVRAPKKSPVPA